MLSKVPVVEIDISLTRQHHKAGDKRATAKQACKGQGGSTGFGNSLRIATILHLILPKMAKA